MDINDFSNWLYETRVMAGMDQNYYQILSWIWGTMDFSVKFLTMFLAIASVIAAAFEMNEKLSRHKGVKIPNWATPKSEAGKFSRGWARAKNLFIGPTRLIYHILIINQKWSWSMRLAAWSSVFATLVIASPIATRPAQYDSLYEQWTNFRADIDTFDLEFKNATRDKKTMNETETACLLQKQQEFVRRVADIERKEPYPYQSLVDYCLRAEERRQGVEDDNIAPQDKTQAADKKTAMNQSSLQFINN